MAAAVPPSPQALDVILQLSHQSHAARLVAYHTLWSVGARRHKPSHSACVLVAPGVGESDACDGHAMAAGREDNGCDMGTQGGASPPTGVSDTHNIGHTHPLIDDSGADDDGAHAAHVAVSVFAGGSAFAGDTARELTPRTNKTGRCLVLLRRPTASPTQYIEWLLQHPVLNRRIFRLYHVDTSLESLVPTVKDLVEILVEANLPQPLRLQFGPTVPGHEVRRAWMCQ